MFFLFDDHHHQQQQQQCVLTLFANYIVAVAAGARQAALHRGARVPAVPLLQLVLPIQAHGEQLQLLQCQAVVSARV